MASIHIQYAIQDESCIAVQTLISDTITITHIKVSIRNPYFARKNENGIKGLGRTRAKIKRNAEFKASLAVDAISRKG